MSSEHGMEDPMLSVSPWAMALGIDPEGCDRVVIDVRRGAYPVVMIEAMPGSRAAAGLAGLVARLDASRVVTPMNAPVRENVAEILEDLRADAESLAMAGDKGRAEFAGHYAGRLKRALGEVSG